MLTLPYISKSAKVYMRIDSKCQTLDSNPVLAAIIYYSKIHDLLSTPCCHSIEMLFIQTIQLVETFLSALIIDRSVLEFGVSLQTLLPLLRRHQLRLLLHCFVAAEISNSIICSSFCRDDFGTRCSRIVTTSTVFGLRHQQSDPRPSTSYLVRRTMLGVSRSPPRCIVASHVAIVTQLIAVTHRNNPGCKALR